MADWRYWKQWQVPVCALIVVAPAVAAVAVLMRFRRTRSPLLAKDLFVSCWRRVHPGWLLAYRGLVFLGMSWLLYWMLVGDGLRAFYFYTQWTFTLVIIYFGIATLVSAYGCWTYSKERAAETLKIDEILKGDTEQHGYAPLIHKNISNDNGTVVLESQFESVIHAKTAGFWGYTMQVIYQTCAGAVILTDVVFWGVLVPFLDSKDFRVNTIMTFMHSVNAVFLLADTALNNLPFPWFGMAYFVFWSCTYVTLQWILHACGLSWWPYPFLELGTPWAVGWYFGMALIHIPCFGVYYLIAKAKDKFFPRLFPNAYVRLWE